LLSWIGGEDQKDRNGTGNAKNRKKSSPEKPNQQLKVIRLTDNSSPESYTNSELDATDDLLDMRDGSRGKTRGTLIKEENKTMDKKTSQGQGQEDKSKLKQKQVIEEISEEENDLTETRSIVHEKIKRERHEDEIIDLL